MEAFERARDESFKKSRGTLLSRTLEQSGPELPPLNLEHLWRMTDHTGLLQHATFSVPNYNEGYCTDDNARGLVLSPVPIGE